MERGVPHSPTDVATWNHLAALLGYPRDFIERVANTAGRFYVPFEILAPGKRKVRRIDNPKGDLRLLQAAIQRRALSRLHLPPFTLGGVAGRSIRHNGEVHIGQAVVVTIDLKDFFPSVTTHHVYAVFSQRLRYVPTLAGVMTRLTTFRRRLPQGAPTSTTLANLAFLPAAERIAEVAHSLGLRFTVWVDDVSLSGVRAREAIPLVIGILREFGFAVSCRKVRVQSGWREAQLVTGVVVNQAVSYGRAGVRKVRAAIREAAALGDHVPDHVLRSLEGKIRHVASLRSPQARGLATLADQRLPLSGTEEPRPARSVYRKCRRRRRRRTSNLDRSPLH